MIRLPSSAVGLLACAALLPATGSATPHVHERRVRAHVEFLADDLLEGRGAGTRGHELAMAYVIAQFSRLGLEPAGRKGYFEPISLRESRLNLEAGRVVIRHASGETALVMLTEAIARPAAAADSAEIAAPASFVGFGIHAPEFGYDDFAGGVDVRGKIAVVLAGSPTRLPATARAHYSRQKTAELVRRGAVGMITVNTPVEEKRTPWAVAANRARFPSMRLVEPDGTLFEAFPEIRAAASVSRSAASALFKHAPTPIDAVFAAAERGEPQAFELGVDVLLAGQATVTDATSANVLAWLPGSDPAMAGEPLVVTAHLDHLGIGQPVDGDAIYNGALDNALGTAVMLAVAEELVAGPPRRRPVLFAALTAEEKGLLGAYHLARHHPERVQRFAANLNLDMPVILGPTRDVIGIGAEHSTLGALLGQAAERVGFTVSADAQPEEVVFVRSDQYPFVRTGVPALFLKSGQRSLDPSLDLAAREADFRRRHYHKPSDDLSQPIHWSSAAAFVEIAVELTRTIANDPVAPAWLAGDFFGTRFGPEARKK